eukprot:CAMPEP_0115891262 /NCGR_PEP_ID=MMETSP0287-20121206/33771_1 /TAXON_ID=412157 /ORGANISM="Chrysochromulina rotalis, Strain UIO044" /LENGTH=194 /DNA_ID=CAMNT_0003348049 /DNA_START=196 /DNA_END=777 /DNA_ORIENTATION=+
MRVALAACWRGQAHALTRQPACAPASEQYGHNSGVPVGAATSPSWQHACAKVLPHPLVSQCSSHGPPPKRMEVCTAPAPSAAEALRQASLRLAGIRLGSPADSLQLSPLCGAAASATAPRRALLLSCPQPSGLRLRVHNLKRLDEPGPVDHGRVTLVVEQSRALQRSDQGCDLRAIDGDGGRGICVGVGVGVGV